MTPPPNLRRPPSHPVQWHATWGRSSTRVTAKLWYDARALASVKLGAPPDEVVLRQVVTNGGGR